ncbi:MAG: Nif3-like dinuclear metal center hexameric protein [Bacteroidia bacterium]
MQIKDIIQHLETLAPKSYQESYDNSGLIVGNQNTEIKGIVVCLDSTEEVIDEAIRKKCNLIVAHHPIVFSGLKSLTAKNYIERALIKAVKNDLAIYAIHTNLDNVRYGVSTYLAQKIGLKNLQILAPKHDLLQKLAVFVPKTHIEEVKNALFFSGVGEIGKYKHCSFSSEGQGTFMATEGTNPHVGNVGETHTEHEFKLEVVFPKHIQSKVIKALFEAHPYEEVAYDIYQLQNSFSQVGSGMIGEIDEIDELEFLKSLKVNLPTDCVRYTKLLGKKVKKVAVCGGSGSFLLPQAIAQGADVFVSADFKYHQFFDADNQIVIADVGHFESEQTTIQLIADGINEKFYKFAVHLTETNTNPVNYL